MDWQKKLCIDWNNMIFWKDNSFFEKSKKYTHNFEWYIVSSIDKKIPVIYKKNIQTTNFKEIWKGMSIFIFLKRKKLLFELNEKFFLKSFFLFKWFNEETWKKYYFLPKFNEKKLEKINKLKKNMNYNFSIKKDSFFYLDLKDEENFDIETIEWSISFLFWLSLLYWKYNIKEKTLNSIKIQIPIYSSFFIENLIEKIYIDLQKTWIFIKYSILKWKNTNICEIIIKDYEILENFKNYIKSIEKIEKIHKLELVNDFVEILIKNKKNINIDYKKYVKKILTKI